MYLHLTNVLMSREKKILFAGYHTSHHECIKLWQLYCYILWSARLYKKLTLKENDFNDFNTSDLTLQIPGLHKLYDINLAILLHLFYLLLEDFLRIFYVAFSLIKTFMLYNLAVSKKNLYWFFDANALD